MPAPPATVRTTKATRTIITSTPKYSARPIATPVSMRSWMGLRSAVRSGSPWYLGPVREWGSKWPVVEASGFTLVVFMALACLRDLGQHIGKIPGAPLIPGDRHQPRIRDWSGASGTTAGLDLLLTQRLQLVLGLTPLHAGLIVTAFAAGSLPVGVLAGGLGSIHHAAAPGDRLPAGQARTLLAAAASAFDNGYTLALAITAIALAITAIALAAGSAFTYRYLTRQPATSTEQARHPEPAHNGGQPPEQAGPGRQTSPASPAARHPRAGHQLPVARPAAPDQVPGRHLSRRRGTA